MIGFSRAHRNNKADAELQIDTGFHKKDEKSLTTNTRQE